MKGDAITQAPSRRTCLGVLAAGLCASVGKAWGAEEPLAGRKVRIAFIDPLSGPMSDIGRNGLRSWQFMAEALSGTQAAPGPVFLVVGFDQF